MSFNDILMKEECTEYVYNKYKDMFDIAMTSGLISIPQKFEKLRIAHGNTEEIHYSYRWKLNE